MQKTVIENCTLYLGDTKEILPALVAEGYRAKCACFDPPYLLTSGGGTPQKEGQIKMSGIFNSDKYDNGGHLVACDIDWPDIMRLTYDALEERAHAYVMANNRNVHDMICASRWSTGRAPKGFLDLLGNILKAVTNGERQPLMEKVRHMLIHESTDGFGFHNLLVWDKVSATPNRWYMKNAEFTGFFYKGDAYEINDCSSMSVIRYPHKDESDHPTEKPVSLMEYYIRNSTNAGDMVLDPFMGSGSTGVACARSGRQFVGIELDAGHYETACRRIRAAYDVFQPGLF